MLRRRFLVLGGAALALLRGVGRAAKGQTMDSITLATINGAPASGLTPKLGDTVTFAVVMTEHAHNPVLQVLAYQHGAVVWGLDESYTGPDGVNLFKLGGDSSPWLDAGGPADCTATLADSKGTLATLQFAANG